MPFIVSPSGGTFLAIRPTAGGQIRSPSLITACRYGRVLASTSEMGDDSVASEISARSFVRTRGVVMMYRKVVRIAVAVVSEPAILN